MIVNSQRTVYGISLQMDMLMGNNYNILPNTTLNEKFNIAKTATLEDKEYPTVKYLAIGVGGSNIVSNLDSYNFSKHKATDASLFEQIPFVMRTLDDDLLSEEKSKYRFRKINIYNNIQYACYYLKTIDEENIRNNLYEVSMSNNIPVLSLFNNNDDKLLNPTPRDPTYTMLDTANTKYIAKVAKIPFTLLKSDMLEIEHVLSVIYGGTNKSITEIGICSGIDKVVENVTEATSVQIMFYYEVDLSTSIYLLEDKEMLRFLEIGGMEPLAL